MTNFKVITRQQNSDDYLERHRRWLKEMNFRPGDRYYEEHQATEAKLAALGEHPDPDAVDAAAGDSVTWLRCDSCDQLWPLVIDFPGSEEDVYICRDCLSKALEAARVLEP